MVHVDSAKCTGCMICVDICPQQAITIADDLAVINENLCVQCGNCAEVCPVGAIREVVPAHAKLLKGGETMLYGYGRGFGRGFGRRGGAGLGFRGASPPWPYVGRGRGGLPRCWYAGVAMASPYPPAPFIYSPQMTQEEDINWLKSQAEATKAELNHVEARIHDLESNK